MRIRVATMLISLLFALSPAASWATPNEEAPTTGTKVLDIFLVRPLSMVGAFASTGLFLGTLPVTFFTGISEDSVNLLVLAPWRFTSARPIGVYDRYKDGRDIFQRP